MPRVQSIDSFDQLKILADSKRLMILRLLMSAPATLTQLGEKLGKHPAWIQHHIKALEKAGLIELGETRKVERAVEKYYRAKGGALLFQQIILPEENDRGTVILSGSHDLAVEFIAQNLAEHLNVLALPVGSLDGLTALRSGLCHLAGAHLFDAPSGEYNAPFVRHIFPDRETILITLTHREQGLIVVSGNPKEIKSISDLARRNITFVNRNKGSGTRLWLDRDLEALGISAKKIKGYDDEVRTHTESALRVRSGTADAALGIRAAADGLDFIPLLQERYDLVIPRDQIKRLDPLLNFIQTKKFRAAIQAMRGYDTAHSGEKIAL
jgi:putative molybdopterin biosynthesis protein